ncbi:hypothetical protein AKJ16_DCAP09018 [Drosera capensis]
MHFAPQLPVQVIQTNRTKHLVSCCHFFIKDTTMASAAASATRQLLFKQTQVSSRPQLYPSHGTSKSVEFSSYHTRQLVSLSSYSSHRNPAAPVKSSSAGKGGVPSAVGDDDDGVSLGTMKLPPDTDIPRFETLLFQWANSLSQGATLPLPMPLKVDKIEGGVRLGFVTIEDGLARVSVHMDCVVIPGTGTSAPIFRAVRNGIKKDKVPAGEPRIMKSLLAALRTSVEIAKV